MMRYAIVTGVSGGLGFATAKFLLESGIHLYGISRTDKPELHKLARENHVEYSHAVCDLSILEQVDDTLEKILTELESIGDLDKVYIINNAAVIQPIKQATMITSEALTYHYNVNVISPIHVLNKILHQLSDLQVTIVGVNITSGAANYPLYGWSAYCSAKASINMYTKTIALEQAELQTDNKIIAFNPGVMDTNMQEEIREADKQHFIQLEQFQQYKREGILSQSEFVAGVLVDILMDESNLISGTIYDISDYT